MKIVKLTPEQFDNFSINHPLHTYILYIMISVFGQKCNKKFYYDSFYYIIKIICEVQYGNKEYNWKRNFGF